MKALILNSGLGRRMGHLTEFHPKCMTEIAEKTTILSRQMLQLQKIGIKEVVITTGAFNEVLESYAGTIGYEGSISFVYNPDFATTNYIYSIFLARHLLNDDVVLMHGDLVFDDVVLRRVYDSKNSCMTVSSAVDLPEKDFKAVIINGLINKVGIEFFENAVAAQPLYKLKKQDWLLWLDEIEKFCHRGEINCYAENALNTITKSCRIYPIDVFNSLCNEVDTERDLEQIKAILEVK
ncbi:MAG: phosphoenolpyruvate phosphomutase [Oscillospiraceae bacterium]|jgi:phosphoenolpyruvate phosphomutase|nr:phosphoenolpyruvate phosphomutase [Oscillospiraceae bacterium]